MLSFLFCARILINTMKTIKTERMGLSYLGIVLLESTK